MLHETIASVVVNELQRSLFQVMVHESSTCSATKKDVENDDERRSGLRRRSGTSSGSGPVQASGASSSRRLE